MTTEWIDQGEVATEPQADPAMAVGEPRNPFLVALGERVRMLRSRQGMTRKAVARAADVSERHLANLEYGTGNASILVLLQVAQALHCTLAELLGDITTSSPEWLLIRELLEHRSEADLRRARQALGRTAGCGRRRARPPRPHRADRFARRRQEHAGQAPGR
jgi:XRE family aerobic/anaerobic benzoate catabolism transcriptional regulator